MKPLCTTNFNSTFVLAATLVSTSMLLPAIPAANAEPVEQFRQQATDIAEGGLFVGNPAALRPRGLEAGAIALRHKRTTNLDKTQLQGQNGQKFSTDLSDDILAAAVLADLGAGAGLGFTRQTQYRKSNTLASRNGATTVDEVTKIDLSTAKLIVELTSELRAGIAIRYLYKDVTVLGEPRLNPSMTTQYKTTMVGYGSGFAYLTKTAGVAYSYNPPLRGKTEVYGEERTVVEPGDFGFDFFFKPNNGPTVGVAAKRWINEVDELATGTTADDDQTAISLYGLDVDQYLIPQQLVMIGADFGNRQPTFRVSVGQETGKFNFRDLFQYQGLGMRQGRNTDDLSVTTRRARGALHFISSNLNFEAGLGYFDRKYTFPEAAGGGAYDAKGSELFVNLGAKI